MVHPMHLHGTSFWVLAAGNGGVVGPDDRLDDAAVPLNLRDAVYRDTVPVPQALGMGMSMGGSGSGDGMGGMAKGGASPSANSAGASTSSSSGSVGMGAMAGGGSGTSGSDSGTSGSDSGNTPGYAVVRFRAANPGVWVFHCHIDLHAASGMLLYFTVSPPAGNTSWDQPPNLECRATPTAGPTASTALDGPPASTPSMADMVLPAGTSSAPPPASPLHQTPPPSSAPSGPAPLALLIAAVAVALCSMLLAAP